MKIIMKLNIRLIQNILLVLCVSLGLNFLPNIFFPKYDVAPMAFIVFLLILYVLLRGPELIVNTTYALWCENTRFRRMFGPIAFLFIFEIIRYPINANYLIYVYILLPILVLLFLLFIVDIYLNYCNGDIHLFLKNYLKSYFLLCVFIVSIAGIVFFLLKIGFVDIHSWTNVGIYGSDFRIRENYSVDSFVSNPYYLTVIFPNFIKDSSFFGEFGTFTGWSFEPHVACVFITPGFLMTNYFLKNRFRKLIVIISFILFYILSLSITAIFSLFIVLFVYLVVPKDEFLLKRFITFVFASFFFIFLIIFVSNYFKDAVLYGLNKIQFENNNSSAYGMVWSYILKPRSFFGNGFLIAPYTGDVSFAGGQINNLLRTGDVGLIPFVNFLFIYGILIFYMIKELFSRNDYLFIGLIMVYLFVHSLKMPFHAFHYLLIFLFIFILSIVPKKV